MPIVKIAKISDVCRNDHHSKTKRKHDQTKALKRDIGIL